MVEGDCTSVRRQVHRDEPSRVPMVDSPPSRTSGTFRGRTDRAGQFCLSRLAAQTRSACTRTDACIRVATQLHRGSPRDALRAERAPDQGDRSCHLAARPLTIELATLRSSRIEPTRDRIANDHDLPGVGPEERYTDGTRRAGRPPNCLKQKPRLSGAFLQSGRQDLNLRPPGPQPGALPDCATPRGRVRF